MVSQHLVCQLRGCFRDKERSVLAAASISLCSSFVSGQNRSDGLWTEGEQVILITTERGYQMTIDFFPAVGVAAIGNGYYELTAAETELLRSLF